MNYVMPLIIITGLPCSGKSYRAQQIASSLASFVTPSSADEPSKTTKRTVQIVPSHHASSDDHRDRLSDSKSLEEGTTLLRDQIYNSASLEKTARAEEFSAIKRALSKDNVVIADGLNYIKGYRYQLWCEAKAAGTRCCVVHVAAQEDECKRWNRERLRAWGRAEVDDDDGNVDGDGKENGNEQQTQHSQGESVLGDLVPESHTAIYGDRIVGNASNSTNTITKSRSSSMDNGLDNGDNSRGSAAVPWASASADETMTLKSLYIHHPADADHPPPSSTDPNRPAGLDDLPPSLSTTSSSPAPSVPIPLPPPPPPPTSSPPYSPSTLISLMMRYEPPSPFSRWDTPLFTVPSSDIAPPIQQIWNAIYPAPPKPTSKKALSQLSPSHHQRPPDASAAGGDENAKLPAASSSTPRDKQAEAVKPHAATVLPRATASDALQTLESATMDVVRHVLAQSRQQNLSQADGEGGDVHLAIPLAAPPPTTSSSSTTNPAAEPFSSSPETVETTIHIPPGVRLSQPMLQRLRRKYTQIQRGGIAHGQGYVRGRRQIIQGFIEFLEAEWAEE
ncbi:uncharacterized protein Z520_06747 [Fonsecaea multimorphosa CBS 102226]|uniref:Uncharacterized protein n=1 Tax=Fonsecaea multimorphosa CBS 102226 TaxID=1442371 RepID=A0A0D2H621_9EURO|nr:uncharacterized protein Z520_06747 [Fonsecaea multimorphosa CBS 102226]KIX97295.1 hypothetical protein Z520_06747 [Fonsecaea multimorphosa CBS 102226]OAL23262.1 hypothetical protein AYO22_06312 [Fonsecaea multimorphosa]